MINENTNFTHILDLHGITYQSLYLMDYITFIID